MDNRRSNNSGVEMMLDLQNVFRAYGLFNCLPNHPFLQKGLDFFPAVP